MLAKVDPVNMGLCPATVATPLPRGEVVVRRLEIDPEQLYYLYWPHSAADDAPLFVTVHGISRNAEEHARRFARFAEAHGVVLVAPLFSCERFPRYQRLSAREGERPADLVLLNILEETGALISVNSDRIYLFGFSGGGQFAHRFAMRHPQRVARYVVAAAGWYTFPDPQQRFPRGMRHNRRMPHLVFDLAAFLSIPASVIVGERDVKPGSALNQNPKIIAQQGENRRERGQRWIGAMVEAARQAGVSPRFSFDVVPACGHSFRRAMRRGNLGELTFSKLFDTTF